MNTNYLLHLAQYTVFLVPLVTLFLLVITVLDRSARNWNKGLRILGLTFALIIMLCGFIITYSIDFQMGEQPPDLWIYWSLLSPPLIHLAGLFFAIGYTGRILELRKNNSQSAVGVDLA